MIANQSEPNAVDSNAFDAIELILISIAIRCEPGEGVRTVQTPLSLNSCSAKGHSFREGMEMHAGLPVFPLYRTYRFS